ncbi:MAG: MBL fold metallo-hydrolase [Planctomycetaceae bacterium]|nr:MBL fold metallo-hydrolase [Planctomycetaceae bacterium]
MQLGHFRLSTISGGRFLIDAGTIFGVVPKPLWSRVIDSDEKNRIQQATNCVLIDTGQQKILVDSGYGSKLPEKQRKLIEAEAGDPLVKSLAAVGLSANDIDFVVLSHLHFDHAGGATKQKENGQIVPTFPNAKYIAQRREWVTATANYPELEGAYPQENLLPLQAAHQLEVVDGTTEIVPGVTMVVTGGHTEGHAAVVIESEGRTAVYLGDLCPSTRHLPSRWCMAYDVDLLETRRQKPEWLGRIADNGWLALFDHDPDHAAAYLDRDDRRDFRVREAFSEL